MLTIYKKSLYLAALTVIISGCGGNSPTRPTPSAELYLPQTTITENKGDIAGLYNAWIRPFKIQHNGFIKHRNQWSVSANEAAIKEGFSRFCLASSGEIEHERQRFGDRYSCSTSTGTMIGEISTLRLPSHQLRVGYATALGVERRKAQQMEYEIRKAQNGPSGVVISDQGRFAFLRIGSLYERDVVEILVDQRLNKHVPIEDVLKIRFLEDRTDIEVTFRDGSTKLLNRMSMRYRLNVDGIGVYGADFPMVVIEPETSKPYTLLFNKLRDIRLIQFDEPSVWQSKPGGEIAPAFDPLSPSRVRAYKTRLVSEANQMYLEALNEGWINLLPDGKLTPQLTDHLLRQLRRTSNSADCRGNVATGVQSIDPLLRCHVAKRELTLVKERGYSLVTDVTPLSSIIVLNKMKDDLR